MPSDPKNTVIPLPKGPHLGMSARTLAREVFRADSPEKFVQNLPAQSIYLAMHAMGFEAAGELLDLTTNDQYKVILDFELWQGDQFSEANFWRWLTALEHEPGIEGYERLLEVIDKRLLGLLVNRHVEVFHAEEPTDAPPERGFYTPDRGSTWLRIRLQEAEKLRMLGKLLALTFEEDSTLFYQLIAEAGYITTSELEEDAYGDKCRRLWGEGFPDPETSARLNTPSSVDQIRALLPKAAKKDDILCPNIQPLAYSLSSPEALMHVIAELAENDDRKANMESELALLANAAVVFFQVDASDPERLAETIERVRGCLNLGAERLKREGVSAVQVCEKLGLQKLYQLGLAEVKALRKFAVALGRDLREQEPDPVVSMLLENLSVTFPLSPAFIRPDGSVELSKERFEGPSRPFAHLVELDSARRILSEAQTVH